MRLSYCYLTFKKNENDYQLHKNLIETNTLKGDTCQIDVIINNISNVSKEDVIDLKKNLKLIKKLKVR